MVEIKDLNIYQKVAKIAKNCGVLRKNKAGFNYKYTTEDEILANVTASMHKYNVALVPEFVPSSLNVVPLSYTKYDKKLDRDLPVNEVIVCADMVYTWVNLDNVSDKMSVPWVVCGQQEDVSQALGGGLTYTNRYFLLKSLQMATIEDDPDNYRSKQKKALLNDIEDGVEEKRKVILEMAKTLTSDGVDKNKLYEIITKHNGNKNPNSIQTNEIADKIISEFNKLGGKK